MRKIRNYLQEQAKKKSKVYIVPSKQGARYIVINFALFLIALTYTNNLALLISFIMISFFILEMFRTHKIISAIKFKSFNIENVFADETLYCDFILNSELGEKELLGLRIDDLSETSFQFKHGNDKVWQGETSDHKRGVFSFKTVRLYTLGSTKLFYVWRFFPCEKSYYVYPSRSESSLKKLVYENPLGAEEFGDYQEHKKYMIGESSKRIDWKRYAQQGELYTKLFHSGQETIWDINYAALEGDKEKRLSQMSFLVQKAHSQNGKWSLRLPERYLEVGEGRLHLQESLELLSAA